MNGDSGIMRVQTFRGDLMTASNSRSKLSSLKKAIGLKTKATKAQTAKWVLDTVYRLQNEYSEIAYGIAHADQTARIDGQMSLGLRNMPASTMAALIIAIHSAGIELSGDVSAWLWQNRDLIVS
jgi:hypothetical protein